MQRAALALLFVALGTPASAQPAPPSGTYRAELAGALTAKPAGFVTLSLRKDGAGTLVFVQNSDQMMTEALNTTLTIRLPSAKAAGSWPVQSFDPSLDARDQSALAGPQAYLSHQQLKTNTLFQLTKVESGTLALTAIAPYSGTFEIRFAADPANGLNAPVTVKGRFDAAQAIEAAH